MARTTGPNKAVSGMEPGSVGRSIDDVVGIDAVGHEVSVPRHSVWLINELSYGSGAVFDDDNRWSISLLTESGELDPRDVSYDGAWEGLLRPEPGIPTWTWRHSEEATAQGWDLMLGDVDEMRFELCAVPEAGRFSNDEAAWRFVWALPTGPAAYALNVLYARSRRSYERVRDYCLADLAKTKPRFIFRRGQ